MNWQKASWDHRDYQLLRAELARLSDEAYRAFHQKLIPGGSVVMGVRMPLLRSVAKEIAKGGGESLFPLLQEEVYEEMMLYGLVLGYKKAEFSNLLPQLAVFMPKINNWAVCDGTVAGLTAVKKERERFFEFLQPYFLAEDEFVLRFAVVSLLRYYTDALWLDQVFAVYRRVRHPGYYVKMAVAWGIAEAFVKDGEKTAALLKEGCLDRETQNKGIQKIRDSYRVTAAAKEAVKAYRL